MAIEWWSGGPAWQCPSLQRIENSSGFFSRTDIQLSLYISILFIRFGTLFPKMKDKKAILNFVIGDRDFFGGRRQLFIQTWIKISRSVIDNEKVFMKRWSINLLSRKHADEALNISHYSHISQHIIKHLSRPSPIFLSPPLPLEPMQVFWAASKKA